jgi:uncharacterized membrane protein YagU involved in acid resistance
MKYFLKTVMFFTIIFAILFIIVGLKFSESAVQESSAAGFACFFGIITRILQAEIHQIKEEPETEELV